MPETIEAIAANISSGIEINSDLMLAFLAGMQSGFTLATLNSEVQS